MRERSETIPQGSRGENPEKVRSLYFLKDPITTKVMYVGSTVNPKHRYTQHLSEARTKTGLTGRKAVWLRNLLRRNTKPIMEVFFTSVDTEEVRRLENWIILRGKLSLLNHKDHAISGRVLTNLVHQYDLGGQYIDTYCNATQASKATGIRDGAILRCCKNEPSAKSAGGFQWSFKATQDLGRLKRVLSTKRVYCEEYAKYFMSAREAERETGISYKRISACLNGRQKSAGGLHWKW